MGSTIRGEVFPSMMSSFSNLDLKGSSPRLDSKILVEATYEQSRVSNMGNLVTHHSHQTQESFSLDSAEKDGFFQTAQKSIWGEPKRPQAMVRRRGNSSSEKQLLANRLPYARCEFMLTRRTSKRIEEDLKTERVIARDISSIMEPIMEENIHKKKVVDSRQLRRSHSVKVPHRSRFEEEVLNKVNQDFLIKKLTYEVKVVKPNQAERVILEPNTSAYFKLKTWDLSFPIECDLGYSEKTQNPFYEVYVSTSTAKPNRNNCSYRFTDQKFKINHDSRVEWLYITISALNEIAMKMVLSPFVGMFLKLKLRI